MTLPAHVFSALFVKETLFNKRKKAFILSSLVFTPITEYILLYTLR